MRKELGAQLGRRERQIVDVVYRLEVATVAEVQAELPDPPSYSAVRAMLNLLEKKGHLKHVRDGMRYLYSPVVTQQRARRSALRHVVSTFFSGSPLAAAAALIEMSGENISPEERAKLAELIARTESKGR